MQIRTVHFFEAYRVENSTDETTAAARLAVKVQVYLFISFFFTLTAVLPPLFHDLKALNSVNPQL